MTMFATSGKRVATEPASHSLLHHLLLPLHHCCMLIVIHVPLIPIKGEGSLKRREP